ncbi:MAG: glycosyltransferase family 4 protein [Candidatus Cryosericum sp.]
MKVLIVDGGYPSTVAPLGHAFVQARVAGYVRAGLDVMVLTGQPGPHSSGRLRGCWDDYDGVHVYRAGHAEELGAVIQEFSPDVVAVHAPNPWKWTGQLAGRLLCDYPVVSWVHGAEVLYMSFYGYYDDLVRRVAGVPRDVLRLRAQSRLLSACDAVVFPSQWLADIARRYLRVPLERGVVIPNPINCIKFAPGPRMLRQVPVGVCVRGMQSTKYGIDIAIRAYAGTRSRLVIVGHGRLSDYYQGLARRLNAPVIFDLSAHQHCEMPTILREFDYFVSPSRTEAQGLAMCEAMACGLPVVGTRVGGIPEFVRDGADGYLVPRDDTTAMAQALERLVREPSMMAQMGRSARQHMLEVCDENVIMAKDIALFSSVVRGRSGDRGK